MAKKKSVKTKAITETPKQRRRCFTCNGEGTMCDDCGEASNVCNCDDGPRESDCEDCFGTGIASADLTEADIEPHDLAAFRNRNKK